MTIDELIERLEEYRETIGGDAEVRLMTQVNWPFENTIHRLVSGEELNDSGDGDDGDVGADQVLYICEGTQIGYGSKRAWDVAN